MQDSSQDVAEFNEPGIHSKPSRTSSASRKSERGFKCQILMELCTPQPASADIHLPFSTRSCSCSEVMTRRGFPPDFTFCGKEGDEVAVSSIKEAVESFQKADSELLCKEAMDQVGYNYCKVLKKHLQTSTQLVQGTVFSTSCAGAVPQERKQLHLFVW